MTSVYLCELALVDGRVRNDVTVAVDGGRIVEIGGQARPADQRIVRLPGLTLPGLANVHSHAFHRALRGRTQVDGGSFWTWRTLMYDLAGRLDPDSYHRLARATFAEMACAGITAVGEFHYLHHRPDGTPYPDANALGQAVLEAAAEVGIRLTLLDTIYLHGGLSADGYRPTTGPQRRYDDGSVAAWGERVAELRAGPNQQVGAAIHSVRAVDPEAMAAVMEWVRAWRCPLHVHLSEQPAENEQCQAAHGASPTALLDRQGVLGPSTTLIHATHLTDDDIATIAGRGAAVCLCPTTESDLGDGIGPSAELVEAGVALSLGSDSNAVIDLLAEARAVEQHQRLRSLRRGVHRAEALLTMATEHGQRALGWTDAGSIASGQRADLVTLSLDSVRTAGIVGTTDQTLAATVFTATSTDVTNVVVDGEPIVVDGRHRSIDVAAELGAAIAAVTDG